MISRKKKISNRFGHSYIYSFYLIFSFNETLHTPDRTIREVRPSIGRRVRSVPLNYRLAAERLPARNARHDGSRPSASRDAQRVAPTAAVPYWLASPYRSWCAPISAPLAPSSVRDRVCTHAGRLAAVTQSISHSVGPRRATRSDLRSYTA